MERINAQNDKSCYMIISTFKQLCTYAGWARHFEPWGWWLHLGCSVIGFNKKKNMLYWQVIQRRAWRSHAGRQHWASHRITASAVRISAPQAAWSYAAHPRPPCDALVYSPTQTHIVILMVLCNFDELDRSINDHLKQTCAILAFCRWSSSSCRAFRSAAISCTLSRCSLLTPLYMSKSNFNSFCSFTAFL